MQAAGHGQGSVFQDKSGRWRVSVNRDGIRRTAMADSERDGHAKRLRMLADWDSHQGASDGPETVATAADV